MILSWSIFIHMWLSYDSFISHMILCWFIDFHTWFFHDSLISHVILWCFLYFHTWFFHDSLISHVILRWFISFHTWLFPDLFKHCTWIFHNSNHNVLLQKMNQHQARVFNPIWATFNIPQINYITADINTRSLTSLSKTSLWREVHSLSMELVIEQSEHPTLETPCINVWQTSPCRKHHRINICPREWAVTIETIGPVHSSIEESVYTAIIRPRSELMRNRPWPVLITRFLYFLHID